MGAMKYYVTARFTLEADSQSQALSMVAACVEYWDEKTSIYNLHGVGGASGHVSIEEKAEAVAR